MNISIDKDTASAAMTHLMRSHGFGRIEEQVIILRMKPGTREYRASVRTRVVHHVSVHSPTLQDVQKLKQELDQLAQVQA